MRRKPNARFENAASNRSQTSATDGGASSNLKRGKGGRVKPWTKTGCVLCVGAALVGGWASATVASKGNETKNAAKRPEVEKARLQALRATRDAARWSAARSALENAARGNENLLPPILNAVEAYATVGEISDTLREVFGEYRGSAAF